MLPGMTVGSAGGVAAPAPEIRPKGMVDEDDDATWEVDGDVDAQPKKKRKVIKNGDKKYHCPHEDCGKAYSRAEHLYRHQLNRMCRHYVINVRARVHACVA